MCGTCQPEGISTNYHSLCALEQSHKAQMQTQKATKHSSQKKKKKRKQQNIEQITMRNNYPSAQFYYHVMLYKNYIKRYNISHLHTTSNLLL